MHRILSLAAAMVAAFIATFTATSAAAQNVQIARDGNYRIAVPYGDLNLASAAGQRTLEGRLDAAAGQVCGAPILPSLLGHHELRNCRQSIVDAARPQLAMAANGRGSGTITLAAAR